MQGGSILSIRLQLTDSAGNDLSAPSVTMHAGCLVRASDVNPTHRAVQSPSNSQPGSTIKYDGGAERFNLKAKGLAPGTSELFFSIAGDPIDHFVTFVLR